MVCDHQSLGVSVLARESSSHRLLLGRSHLGAGFSGKPQQRWDHAKGSSWLAWVPRP